MPKVFVSHSAKDRAFVEQEIVPLLRSRGIETWYAPDEIRSGDEWVQKIAAGLRSCDWFLVVISPESVASAWVKTEVHWATEYRRGRIIPVLVRPCDLTDLHLMLLPLHYVDFRQDRDWARNQLLAT